MLYKQFSPVCTLCCALLMLPGCWRSEEANETREPRAEIQQAEKKHAATREVASVDEFNDMLKEGKPMVADFYAPWCGPCQTMKPIFHTVAEKYGQEVNFVTLNADDKNLRPLFDKYSVTGYPTLVFINANGAVAQTESGVIKESNLESMISDLLKQARNP